MGKYELDSCRDCDNDYGDDTGNYNGNDDTDKNDINEHYICNTIMKKKTKTMVFEYNEPHDDETT